MTSAGQLEDFLFRLRGGVERVTERCAYCDFTVEAPFEQAREAFAEHVCDRPKPTTTRRRSGFSSFRRS